MKTIDEEIKINDQLNPALWDNNELKEDVKEKLLDIVDNFLDGLKEDKINIDVVDVRLLGSNANYNYTDKSDIDLHIVADFSSTPCEQNVMPQLYNAYRSLFSKAYDIKINGYDVELYVEDVNQPARSNGVYSLYTGWVSEPKRSEIPEINWEQFELVFDGMEDRYFDVVGEHSDDEPEVVEESLLQEGKQDKENFKKWAEQAVEIAYKDRGLSDWERRGNAEYIVNWFENNRKNLKSPQNDYYYWIKEKNVQGAYDELNRLASEQEKKKNSEKKSKEGAKLIYSDNDWKVYEITTYEASVKYGANTKWCISGSKRWSNGENGRGYWDDYTSEGVKFYFFINKDTKYAIAIYPNGTDFEIFDAQDNSIAYIPNAPIIDEIKVDYYSHNEDRLMLNLIKTGQLPHVCSILSSYLWKCNYYTDIYTKSDFDAFLHAIEENVNADYVKWLAVYDGLKDEEWYKQETGEEYEDEWMGDTTNYIYINFLDGYATLDDALTKDNQKFYYDESEYFINDLYECDILCCKDWVGVWLHIDKYIKDETDLINFIKKDIRDNWNYEDFEKVGLSKEYLLEESLEEHLGSNINEAFSYTDSTNVNNLTDLDRQYFDYIYSGQSNKAKEILNKLALDWGALSKGNKPLKLYHGTIVDKDRFTKFDAKKGYNVDAIYFTNVPEVAHHFIGNSNYNSINNRSFNDNALTKLLTNAGRDVNKLLDILNNHLYQNYEIKSQTNDDGELEYFLVDGDGSYSTTSWLGAKIDDETYVRYEWGNKDKPIKTNLPDKFIYDIERYIYYVNNIGQTYCCYLKMNNPLIIDAKKHPFYEVEFEGKELNTETISYLAKERGYDGVIIKNVLETNYANAKCDDYIVFDANQIKSCDLITCNDNGYIIPPSKRFTTSDDIREEMQEHLGSNVELEEDFKSFKQSLKFPLEVYRGLSANSKESIDLKNVGKSWTTNPNLFLSSDTTLGNYISASSCNYILTGYVDEDDVDWEQTETAFNNFSNDYWYSEDEFDYDCECEITLRNGATPKNIKIETREEFYGDDLEEQLKQNVDLEEDYANNIDRDILDTIKNPLDKLYKNTKCSKSAGTMLDYYFYETDKPLKLCVGAIRHKGDDSEPKSIAHVWIEVDGKVRETNFPDGDYERVLVDELLVDRDEDLYNQVKNFLNKTSLRECLQESLTESKVMSDRIKGLIDKAYDYCKQAGWDFSNPQTFKSSMLVNYPLKISLGNETAHRLGLAKYPVKGITEIVLAPQIDKFENDESILSVILHELGHIIAYDDDFARGYVEYSDKYDQAIVRSKAIKKKLSHHGQRWKDVVEKLSEVSGISLQRLTNAEDTTEWNNINKDKYKYFFECPNCHCKLKYTRATEFVRTYNDDQPNGDPYWWCSNCKQKTGNKIKFVKIDGGDYNG